MTSLVIPERIVELPLEMQCQIISNIHDVPTIGRFLASNSVTLVEVTRQCIREITLEEGELLPFYIIRQLINLEKVTGDLYVDNVELILIATLPRLTEAKFIIPPINIDTLLQFLGICEQFVTTYCQSTYIYIDMEGQTRIYQNNRNFDTSEFSITSSHTDPYKTVTFEPIDGYPIIDSEFIPLGTLGFSPGLGTITVDQLIAFMTNYQRYTSITIFDDRWLRLLFDFFIIEARRMPPASDKLIAFMSSLPDLTDLRLNYDPRYFMVTLSLMIYIFRQTVDNVYVFGYVDITFAYYFNLGVFPNSSVLRVFDIPIYIDQIPQVLAKYPNNRNIQLYGWNRQANLEDNSQPLSLQQITEILDRTDNIQIDLITPNPELYPIDIPRLEVVTLD